MLVVETIGKIRRAYFVQGKPIKNRLLRAAGLEGAPISGKLVRGSATRENLEKGDLSHSQQA